MLLGNGDGTFQNGMKFNGPSETGLAIADVNADGKPDIIASGFEVSNDGSQAGSMDIYFGNGNGTFRNPISYTTGRGNPYANSVVAADFNHDGNVDVAVAETGGSLQFFWGQGKGVFQPGADIKALPSINVAALNSISMSTGDLNGDGIPDLVLTAADGYVPDSSFCIPLINDGAGNFTPTGKFAAGDLQMNRVLQTELPSPISTATEKPTY